MNDWDDFERALGAEMSERGLRLSHLAMNPLRKIDASALAKLETSEQEALFTHFVRQLVAIHQAKLRAGYLTRQDEGLVHPSDVLAAILNIGQALQLQPPAFLSEQATIVLRDMCVYCTDAERVIER